MIWAMAFSLSLFVACVISLWPRKTTRLGLLNKTLVSKHTVFKKLNAEVKIFNKLKLRLPMTRRRCDVYLKWLGKLYINPLLRPKVSDPIDRLMHAYALGELYTLCSDHFKRRQIYKAMLCALSPIGVVYRRGFGCARPPKIGKRQLFAIKQPTVRFMQTKFVERSEDLVFAKSYVTKKIGEARVKNSVAIVKGHPVECNDIVGSHRFSFDTKMDKMACFFSHTADTFFVALGGRAIAVLVDSANRVNFETNIVSAGATLLVSVHLKAGGRVCVIEGSTKAQVASLATNIRTSRSLNYLNTAAEVARNNTIENLYGRAYMSKFIRGEKLKSRMEATRRVVPSINLPTIVYDVTTPEEFFVVIDNFENFKRMSWAGVNTNVVVMYSSLNDTVREYIAGFAKKNDAKDLIKNGVFLFFIDKIRASNDVVYVLSKMLEVGQCDMSGLRTRDDDFKIISRKGVSYSSTSLRTGVTKYHQIKPGHDVVDMFGVPIKVGVCAICVGPAYITTCQKSRSKKCTDAATTMSTFVKRSKTQKVSQNKLQVDIHQ